MYKANFALCCEVHIKHSMQIERHVEFLNIKPDGR